MQNEVLPSSHIIYGDFSLRDGKSEINVIKQKAIVNAQNRETAIGGEGGIRDPGSLRHRQGDRFDRVRGVHVGTEGHHADALQTQLSLRGLCRTIATEGVDMPHMPHPYDIGWTTRV